MVTVKVYKDIILKINFDNKGYIFNKNLFYNQKNIIKQIFYYKFYLYIYIIYYEKTFCMHTYIYSLNYFII